MYAHHGSSARRLLVAALIPLAADAASQQAWLESFPIATDDLMYDFDNALPVFAHEEADEIDAAAVMGDLRMIGDHFREMCGDRPSDPWTYEALATDPAWAAVRDLARDPLRPHRRPHPPHARNRRHPRNLRHGRPAAGRPPRPVGGSVNRTV